MSTNFFQRPLIPQNPNPEPPEFPLLRDMLFRRIALMQSDPYGGQTFSSAGRGLFNPYGGGYSGGGMGSAGGAMPPGVGSVLASLIGGGGFGGGMGHAMPPGGGGQLTGGQIPHEAPNNPSGSDAEFERESEPRDEEAHRHAPSNTTPSYAGVPAGGFAQPGAPPGGANGPGGYSFPEFWTPYDVENWFAGAGPMPTSHVPAGYTGPVGGPGYTGGGGAARITGTPDAGSGAPGPGPGGPRFTPSPAPNPGGPSLPGAPTPNPGGFGPPSWNPKAPAFHSPFMNPGGSPNPNPPPTPPFSPPRGNNGSWNPWTPGTNIIGLDAEPAYAAMPGMGMPRNTMMHAPRVPMMHPAALHQPRPIMQMLLARGVHPRPAYAGAPTFTGGAPVESPTSPGPMGFGPRSGTAPTPTPAPAPTPTPAPTPGPGDNSGPAGPHAPNEGDMENPDYGRNELNLEMGKKPQPGGAK